MRIAKILDEVKPVHSILYVDFEPATFDGPLRLRPVTLNDTATICEILSNEKWFNALLFLFARNAKHEVLRIFWNFVKENFDQSEQKLILMRTDQLDFEMFKWNVLMVSLMNRDKLSTKFMLQVAHDLLEPDTFREHLFFAEFIRQNSEIFDQFENFTKSEIRYYLLNTRYDGYNLLQYLAMNGPSVADNPKFYGIWF